MTPVWLHYTQPGYDAMSGFISNRVWGDDRSLPLGTIMAVADGDSIVGGIAFTNYDPEYGVVEITGASDTPRFLTRPILWQMYNYAFNEIGCQAVIQRNDPDNTRLARMLESYGFKRYDIDRLRGRNKGEAVFVLHDDIWRTNGFHKENENG